MPDRAGCHCADTAAAAEGPVGAMPEMLWIVHPFACQYSVFHVTVSEAYFAFFEL